jgi:hypothetical protein
MMTERTSTYMDLRMRGEGDVARTVEIVSGELMVDVSDEGLALGIEKLGGPLTFHDLMACLLSATFGRPRTSVGVDDE